MKISFDPRLDKAVRELPIGENSRIVGMFRKKTQKTPKQEIKLASKRFNEYR